jgi:hypothetical protein
MKNYRDLPFALQNLVDSELVIGERLVWVSRPRPRFFSPASAGIVLFSVPWTTFAVIWTVGAAMGANGARGAAAWFPLIGLPFILTGIWMFFSPVWAFRTATRTVYAITDRRAFTIERGWVNKIRSYSPRDLRETQVREHTNGSGDIIISSRDGATAEERVYVSDAANVDSSDSTTAADTFWEEHGFFHIDRPKEVEQLLRDLALLS